MHVQKSGFQSSRPQYNVQADNVPGSKLSGDVFTRFWISYSQGTITVGLGEPGPDSCHYSWTDTSPIPDLKHVGLSTWDKHVGYKQIQMRPAVSLHTPFAQQKANTEPLRGAQSLRWLCRQSIEQHLDTHNLCSILHGVEVLAPALDQMKEPLVACLADNLEQVVQGDPDGFCSLPCACLMDLLSYPGLVRLLSRFMSYTTAAQLMHIDSHTVSGVWILSPGLIAKQTCLKAF